MSILSRQFVADNVARLFAALIKPAPKPAVRFPDVRGRTSEITVPTRYGNVAATLYHPSQEPAGVYVNIHGGGFVVGHREQDDPWCRYLAAHAGVVVLNTDYVLAPGHRFPAAPQQIYDVVSWAAREWPAAPICVGGQSAGGSLAAAAARMALENGGPALALQVLHYAPLDLVTPTGAKRSALGDKAVMKPWMGRVFDTAYIPDPAQRNDRLASPALDVADLTGIAPALVVTAEYDRLRDEGRRYANALQAAGALAEYYEVHGVDHGYNIMSDAADVTLAAYGHITSHVRRAITERDHAEG